jgi:hypothetical protein
LKNRTNFIIGITVCGLSVVGVNVINFWPIKLSFAINTRFFVTNSFAALFLCMIENLAVDAEFTVSGSVVALILR